MHYDHVDIWSQGEVVHYLNYLVGTGQVRKCSKLRVKQEYLKAFYPRCTENWASRQKARNVTTSPGAYSAPSSYAWPICPKDCPHYEEAPDFTLSLISKGSEKIDLGVLLSSSNFERTGSEEMKDKATTEINNYWKNLPFDRAALGNVTSDITICGDGKGFSREHQYGAIYWRQKVNCKSVYGAIWKLYSHLGKERSYLGYPVTEEEWTPDKMHRYSTFENGVIAWHRLFDRAFPWPAELNIPRGAVDVINITRNMLLDFHIAQRRLGDRGRGKESFEIGDEYDV